MNVNEEATKAVNVIVSALEHELPEWEVYLTTQDGQGIAMIRAEVRVGEGQKRFYCQHEYSYRDLTNMHPAMLPSRGIDLALRWRNELRKAKKDASKFGV